MLSLLSFGIFLPVDLDLKVQRTSRLICWACVYLFCLFFSTAFAIGTKMKDSYTSETVARVQKERVDRIGKSVFIMIHVSGTRCVTSSTDNIMKIHAGITLTVECIRTCLFVCLVYV